MWRFHFFCPLTICLCLIQVAGMARPARAAQIHGQMEGVEWTPSAMSDPLQMPDQLNGTRYDLAEHAAQDDQSRQALILILKEMWSGQGTEDLSKQDSRFTVINDRWAPLEQEHPDKSGRQVIVGAPEPYTVVLFGSGLILLAILGRKLRGRD